MPRTAYRSNDRTSEIIGVLLIALAILAMISLISHSPEDWPNSSRPRSESANWAGWVGAFISYAFLFVVGYAAYPLPVLIFLWGINRLRRSGMGRLAVKTVAIVLALILYCGASTIPSYEDEHTAFKLGGWFGMMLSSKLLIPYFGKAGSYVLVAALLAVAFLLGTDIQLSEVLSKLSRRGRMSMARRKGKKPRDLSEGTKSRGSAIESPEPRIVGPTRTGQEAAPREGSEMVYEHPSTSILDDPPKKEEGLSREDLLENAKKLEVSLSNFGVEGKVVQISPGPVITRYEVEPAAGVKVSRIVALDDDLALAMRARRVRIEAPIPGKAAVGIEIPNPKPSVVYLKEILESEGFQSSPSKLAVALGKTTSGEPFCADLARMPHLLIAGATGSGKSVCVNCLISSILFRADPEEVRFIMVDPKMLELPIYNDIPHLLAPVVTEPKKASEALGWAVGEMEARYQSFAKLGVRNIVDYNQKVAGTEDERLSYIVVIIDELADLMMSAPRDFEDFIARLAQMARAVGIHLVLATQRPSVNVITGVIKANFPSRIAFQVASKVDSRIILDTNGAENLLGSGDMLFLPPGRSEPIRIHGSYISTAETERLVEAVKSQRVEVEEFDIFAETEVRMETGRDELFHEAARLVIQHQQGSVSLLQRRLRIGYSRAARLIDELEEAGIVGPFDGSKAREVLLDESFLERMED